LALGIPDERLPGDVGSLPKPRNLKPWRAFQSKRESDNFLLANLCDLIEQKMFLLVSFG